MIEFQHVSKQYSADATALREKLGAAEFDFVQRGLNQGIAEIPMVIGVERFACRSRRHFNVMIYNF